MTRRIVYSIALTIYAAFFIGCVVAILRWSA